MAFRRHELTRRRKAVGFTQESLAEQLGVERSTVIRWEAGDSEPLPSIRPSLARALQVSIDQLAELLTASADEGTTDAPSADLEGASAVLLPEAQLPGRPDGPELVDLIHPQVAEALEALRQALRTAGASAEDLAAMLLAGGSSRVPPDPAGPEISEPVHAEAPGPPAPILPDLEPAEAERRRAASRRHKWLAAAGLLVLVLPAAWLSAPFVFPPAQAPAVAVFAGSAGKGAGNTPDRADSAGVVPLTPIVVPPVEVPPVEPAPPAAPVVPDSSPPEVTGSSRTASRSESASAPYRPLRLGPELMRSAAAGDHWNYLSQLEHAYHLW